MFAEFWAGRLSPYLGEHPAVVVQAVEEPEPVEVSVWVASFASTGDAVEAAELDVLGRLAALSMLCAPWDAARVLFRPTREEAV